MNDIPLIEGLHALPYVYANEHAYLAEDFGAGTGPNIGGAGENLTIMLLSMDRANLTARLCRSIVGHVPHFEGQVLVVDNGSQPDQLLEIEKLLAELPLRSKLLKLGQNHGVAGGRSIGIDHVETEWVMSLDNDIYFIADPFKHWQHEIATLGCRFFSLALLDPDQQSIFLRGGHLYVTYGEGQIHLGGGSAGALGDARTVSGPPFLGTCMMGGASIFDVALFKEIGRFDAGMFVGFEDIELSLRLFRKGYKIGCTALAALVHDHAKPETSVDRDYERIRFRRNDIEESARHFESKHGYKVWNRGVDDWLTERERALGLQEARDAGVPRAHVSRNERPNIMLVADIFGWAFSNICDQIHTQLSDEFNITVHATDELKNHGDLCLLARNQDLVHLFWRPQVRNLFSENVLDYARGLGFPVPEDIFGLILDKRVTTAVYDHLYLSSDEVEWLRPVFDFVDGYYTSSRKLDAIYQRVYGGTPPQAVIQDGVDLSLFRPRNLGRFQDDRQTLTVGWVGNSDWAAEVEDFKGLHTIINPALENLRAKGLQLESRFADKKVVHIPHADMPDYYAGIDVLLCASKIEGTPNPLLEAMAMGVPVITTDVGIVPEALGPKQSGYILPSRDVHSLMTMIERLYRNRSDLEQLSDENLDYVKPWDWSLRVEGFRNFFRSVLAAPARHKQRLS
ncbi:glycosyltransferase [Arvimicrobium flavum]|uniref:glycosyltransferase n=1 Tax=Arvimicrobium flavum TaxID=3393320 RepID=UPI00237BB5E5|nr:glycosyltransferase [Mesorhizobium shangrilense]